MRRLIFGLACAGALLRPAPGLAADRQQLKRLSLEELGEIVVTSVSKQPEQVWATPAAIAVLTHDDIVRSGATDLGDVLRLVPGVEVARIDSSRNWVVGVRGFGDQFSKSLLVMIDGRSLYTPLFGGVHWSLQNLLLDDIERIEIIRGPGGTIWGANAVNGVINIITRAAAQTTGTFASLSAGNLDEVIGGVRYGGAAGRHGSYRVYGTGFKRGPEWHPDDREFDRWHMGQEGFRFDWSRDRDSVTVHGDAYAGQIGESVQVSSFAPPASALVDRPADVSGQNVMARWDRKLSGSASVTVQTYWDRTDRLGTDFGETRNTFDLDLVHAFSPAPGHAVIWGGGFRLSPSRYTQTIEAADFEPHDQRYDLYSGYAQDAIRLPHQLTVTGGVKLEHNTYTGLEIEPSGSLLWAPAPHQSAWFAITRAIRPPSRIDTDISVEQFAATVSGTPIFAHIFGTRDINSEALMSVEGGYRALFGRAAHVDVAVFNHRYDGLVSIDVATTQTGSRDGTTYLRFDFPFINSIDGTTRGVEIAPDVTVAPGVTLRGSYSWLSPDLSAAPDAPTNPITTLTLEAGPHHQVVLQGILSRRQVEVSPVLRYVSRRALSGVPAYTELDLPVSLHVSRQLPLSIVGQNLLHDHHPEWTRDPGPTVEIRRAGYLRLTWSR